MSDKQNAIGPVGPGSAEVGRGVLPHPTVLSRLVGDEGPAAMVLLDGRDRVLWANAGFRALVALSDVALAGRHLADLLRLVTWLPGGRGEAESASRWQRIWLHGGEGGEPRMVLMAETCPAGAPSGVAKLLTFVDLQVDGSGLWHPPLADPRTGLASTWVFEDRLRHALERADRHDQELAVLLIRLDHLELLYQRAGEATMPLLLQQVSRRLAGALRREDSITYLGEGRWGVLVEHSASPEALQAVGLRCQEAMEAPFNLSGTPLLVTLSIGIARHPDDGDSLECLMAGAEQALCHARASSLAFLDRRLRQQLGERLAFQQDLQEALLCPDRHFQVVYQPQRELATGRCTGVEALVRWQHPRLGALRPARFLPQMVEMGLVVRLDRWVIQRVIDQHRHWVTVDSPLADLEVAVNIDASLLEPAAFDGRPLDCFLGEQGVALDWLSLEVDGAELSARHEAQGLVLHRLARRGVNLVADNLGQAALDLPRLAQLPLSRGKIGRELVQALIGRDGARRALGALAHSLVALELESVMVGVETPDQLGMAQRVPVGHVQGYLVSAPLPPEALEAWMHASAAGGDAV